MNEEGTSLVAQQSGVCLPVQGHRFNPWSGKFPHAAEQLSLCTTTAEPASRNKRSHPVRSLHTATRESPHEQRLSSVQFNRSVVSDSL